jgi:hypothetical protein
LKRERAAEVSGDIPKSGGEQTLATTATTAAERLGTNATRPAMVRSKTSIPNASQPASVTQTRAAAYLLRHSLHFDISVLLNNLGLLLVEPRKF